MLMNKSGTVTPRRKIFSRSLCFQSHSAKKQWKTKNKHNKLRHTFNINMVVYWRLQVREERFFQNLFESWNWTSGGEILFIYLVLRLVERKLHLLFVFNILLDKGFGFRSGNSCSPKYARNSFGRSNTEKQHYWSKVCDKF